MKKQRKRPSSALLLQLGREQSEAEAQCESSRAGHSAWGELADLWAQLGRNLGKAKKEAESMAAEETPFSHETGHSPAQGSDRSICHVACQTDFGDALPELQSLLHELAQVSVPANRELTQEWLQAKVAAAVQDWSSQTWTSHGSDEVSGLREKIATTQFPGTESNVSCPGPQAEPASPVPLEEDMVFPAQPTPSGTQPSEEIATVHPSARLLMSGSADDLPVTEHHVQKLMKQADIHTTPSVSATPCVGAGNAPFESQDQEEIHPALCVTPGPPIPTALSTAQTLEQSDSAARARTLSSSSLDHRESVSQSGEPDITLQHESSDAQTGMCSVFDDQLCLSTQAEQVPPVIVQHAASPRPVPQFGAPIELDPEELEAGMSRQMIHSSTPQAVASSGSGENMDVAEAAERVLLSECDIGATPASQLVGPNTLQHPEWAAKPEESRAAFATPNRNRLLDNSQVDPAFHFTRGASTDAGGGQEHPHGDAAGRSAARTRGASADSSPKAVRDATALTPSASYLRPHVDGATEFATTKPAQSSMPASQETCAPQHLANKAKPSRPATASSTRRRSASASHAQPKPIVDTQFARFSTAPMPSSDVSEPALEEAFSATSGRHPAHVSSARAPVLPNEAREGELNGFDDPFDDFAFANPSLRLSRSPTPQLQSTTPEPSEGPARRVGPAELALLEEQRQPSRSSTPQPSRHTTPQPSRNVSPQQPEGSQAGPAAHVGPAELALLMERSQPSRSTTPQPGSRSTTPLPTRSTSPQPSEQSQPRSATPQLSEGSQRGPTGKVVGQRLDVPGKRRGPPLPSAGRALLSG